jgi:hypothetical protein
MPIATRLTNAGTLLVNGSFDENTSIAPAKFRTTSTTVSAGTLDEVSLAAGAISFNGTSQYLTATSPNLSGTWTVEMWCYWTTGGTQTTIVSFNNGSNSGINLWKNSSNQLVADDGVNGVVAMSTVTPTINAWNHIAFVRVGTTTSGYVNGVLAGTTTYTPGTTSAVSVGRYNGSPFYYFPGYISNLRVVNGTAVYTAAFTPPQAILPSITNTSLLLNATDSANFIRDNGPNNLTVTNNGTATWIDTGPFNQGSTTLEQRQVNDGTLEVYSTFDEFTGAPVVDTSLQLWLDAGQTASYPGSGTTWTDLSGAGRNGTLTNGPTYSNTNGGFIVFDGTNDFVQCSGSLTVTAATFVCWIRRNGTQGQYDGILFSRGTNTTGMNFYTSNQLGYHWNDASSTYNWSSGLTVPDLTWCMIAISVTSTAATAYLCQTSEITTANNTVNHSSSLLDDIKIAQDDAGSRFFNGSIATAMIYNRALTADEITTNFNALRGRYGI